MAYEDVPQRMRDGEQIPRSEIIGHFGADKDVIITLCLETLAAALILNKTYSEGTVKYGLTPLGLSIRESLIKRLEGDCPDCPE